MAHPGGRPVKFTSPDKLLELFDNYIIHCIDKDKMPNIAGFSVFGEFNPDTFYEYKNNKAEFSEAIKTIELTLEDVTIQELFTAKNPAGVIFYLKNKFKYVDRQEIDQSIAMVRFSGEDKLED